MNFTEEYSNKFEEFVGIKINSNGKYNQNQMLEIMARSLAFWYLEKIDASFDLSLELQTQCFYVSEMYCSLLKSIMDKFNNVQQKIIFDRFEILKNKNRNNEILNIKKKLLVISNVSIQLYDKFITNINDNNGYVITSFNFMIDEIINNKIFTIRQIAKNNDLIEIFKPIIWLANQTLMREFYEKYNYKFNELKNKCPDNILVDKFIDNEFIIYFKFMYNNYPDKYGEEIKKKYDQVTFCDGAELYYELNREINL